jgi:hypothetical protein
MVRNKQRKKSFYIYGSTTIVLHNLVRSVVCAAADDPGVITSSIVFLYGRQY